MRPYAAVALAFAAGAIAAGPASADIGASSDPILYWNDVAIGLPGSPSAPVQTRTFAMVNIAMHDAVNATLGGPNSSFLKGIATPGGDTRAAASQAAYTVLVALNASGQPTYKAALDATLALIPDSAAKSNGITTGTAYGNAIFANRTGDGMTAVVGNPVTGRPDEWQPTPMAFAQAALQQWGGVTPFVMSSGAQFRPGPPPELNSDAWVTAFNEVKTIGVAMGSTRTAEQTQSALFWNAANGTQWLRIGLTIAEDEGLSTLGYARAFALLTTALADTQIAGFDAKRTYDFWRPVTAIRGDDGNMLTDQDGGWTPLNFAPAHQSYLSTLSALSAAGSTTLASLFGDDEAFDLTIGGTKLRFNGLAAAAEDAASSRLWGGIHYRFDSEAGLRVGTQIAQLGLAGATFNAVPEPANWVMMIAGFGLIGGVIRRRRVSFAPRSITASVQTARASYAQ